MIPFARWYEAQFEPRHHMLDGRLLLTGTPHRWRKRQAAKGPAAAPAHVMHARSGLRRAPSVSRSGC